MSDSDLLYLLQPEPDPHRYDDPTAVVSSILYVYSIIMSFRSKLNKYQLSLTNLRDALHHGNRAANKRGRSV